VFALGIALSIYPGEKGKVKRGQGQMGHGFHGRKYFKSGTLVTQVSSNLSPL
jgi:hypothetical protein